MLESFTPLQRDELEQYVAHQFLGHKDSYHQSPLTQREIYGGNSPDAKQDIPMPTPETAIMAISSLVSALGEELRNLDILITFLTNTRNRLQFAYSNVQAGDSGRPVVENLDYNDHKTHIQEYETLMKRRVKDNPQA